MRDQLTVYVTMYGLSLHGLHQRWVHSLLSTNVEGLRVIVGVNLVGDATMNMLNDLPWTIIGDRSINQGKYPLLRQAIAQCETPYMLVCDDDIVFTPKWQEYVRLLQFTQFDITGELVNAVEHNPKVLAAWEQRQWYQGRPWLRRRSDKAVKLACVRGACFALNLDKARALGWPDTHIRSSGGDLELSALAYQNGLTVKQVEHGTLCDMDNTKRRGFMKADEIEHRELNGY